MNEFGADRVDVLMLAVDMSYFKDEKDNLAKEAARLKAKSITWPNVLLPAGWDTVKERFNVGQYGLSVIGPDGKVLALGAKPGAIKAIIERLENKAQKAN